MEEERYHNQPATSGNVIQRENDLPGSSAWQIQPGHEATTEILSLQ